MLTTQALNQLIGQNLGLRLRAPDREPLQRWTAARANQRRQSVEEWAQQLLDTGPEGRLEREAMTVRLTTGETYFLRDKGLFDLLAKRLLPELIERRTSERRLRIWSAGCASGEEAYSLAMLIRESSASLADWDIQILGTDINSEALAAARRGEYREWSFRALDSSRKERYFHARERHWVVTKELRPLVKFIHADLIVDSYPDISLGISDIDLILCRNVFIYMQPEAIASVTSKLASSLAEGGYLITGHGELVGHNSHGLHKRVFPASVVLHKQSDAPQFDPLPTDPVPATDNFCLPPLATDVSSVCLPETDVQQGPDIAELTRDAWQHAHRGDADAAKAACAAAIKINALDPWPYYIQAQLAQEKGDCKLARQMLERVIYLDSTLVAAHVELSGILEQGGNRGGARRMLSSACRELRKRPGDELIQPYEATLARDMLHYLESRLNDLPASLPVGHKQPDGSPI